MPTEREFAICYDHPQHGRFFMSAGGEWSVFSYFPSLGGRDPDACRIVKASAVSTSLREAGAAGADAYAVEVDRSKGAGDWSKVETTRLPFLTLPNAAVNWPGRARDWSRYNGGGERWTRDTLFRVHPFEGIQQLPAALVGREAEIEQRIADGLALFNAIDRPVLTGQASSSIDKLGTAFGRYQRELAPVIRAGAQESDACPEWDARFELHSLLEECDTACAVIRFCNDLDDQCRDRLRDFWCGVIQPLKCELQPRSAYAEACAENMAALPSERSASKSSKSAKA